MGYVGVAESEQVPGDALGCTSIDVLMTCNTCKECIDTTLAYISVKCSVDALLKDIAGDRVSNQGKVS